MNLLFICTHNKFRSRTAEVVFKDYMNCQTKSAGTSSGAKVKLNPELIAWADIIFVMEEKHKQYLEQKLSVESNNCRIEVLGIPDNYTFMHPKLIELLKSKVEVHLE